MRFTQKIAIVLISTIGFAACLQAMDLSLILNNEHIDSSSSITHPIIASKAPYSSSGKRKKPEKKTEKIDFFMNLPEIMQGEIFKYLSIGNRVKLLAVSQKARKNTLNNKIQGPVNDKPDVILSSKKKDSQENFIVACKSATSTGSLLHVSIQNVRGVKKRHEKNNHHLLGFPYPISFEEDSEVAQYIKYGPIGTLSFNLSIFYKPDIEKLLKSEQGKKPLSFVRILNMYKQSACTPLEKLYKYLSSQLIQLNMQYVNPNFFRSYLDSFHGVNLVFLSIRISAGEVFKYFHSTDFTSKLPKLKILELRFNLSEIYEYSDAPINRERLFSFMNNNFFPDYLKVLLDFTVRSDVSVFKQERIFLTTFEEFTEQHSDVLKKYNLP